MSQLFRQHIESIIPLTDEEYNYILLHFTKKNKKHQFLLQEGDTVINDYW
jgi:hypothetical protein